jgi:hypothetical protein
MDSRSEFEMEVDADDRNTQIPIVNIPTRLSIYEHTSEQITGFTVLQPDRCWNL